MLTLWVHSLFLNAESNMATSPKRLLLLTSICFQAWSCNLFSYWYHLYITVCFTFPRATFIGRRRRKGWIYSGSQTILLEHFCVTSAIVIWVAGHGPANSSWFSEIGFCNSRKYSAHGVVDFRFCQKWRSKANAALETYSGVYICSPDFARKHNCATCVLYTIRYPLDAVCLPCLFDRLQSS